MSAVDAGVQQGLIMKTEDSLLVWQKVNGTLPFCDYDDPEFVEAM